MQNLSASVNGHCILCLAKTSRNSDKAEGEESKQEILRLPGKEIETSSKSNGCFIHFQNLCRVLKIELNEDEWKSLVQQPTSGDDKEVGFQVSFCESCSEIGKYLTDLFLELNRVKTQIKYCLGTISEKIGNSLDTPGGHLFAQIVFVDKLRKEIFDKCSRMFKEAEVTEKDEAKMDATEFEEEAEESDYQDESYLEGSLEMPPEDESDEQNENGDEVDEIYSPSGAESSVVIECEKEAKKSDYQDESDFETAMEIKQEVEDKDEHEKGEVDRAYSPSDSKFSAASDSSKSTSGPTGLLRSADGEPVKKNQIHVVILDHITLLGGDPLMFQCNICKETFNTKANIKYHDFCKEKAKPFKCETCGQGFITKLHYEYHLRTHFVVQLPQQLSQQQQNNLQHEQNAQNNSTNSRANSFEIPRWTSSPSILSEPALNNSGPSGNAAGNGVPATSAELGANTGVCGVANRTKELPVVRFVSIAKSPSPAASAPIKSEILTSPTSSSPQTSASDKSDSSVRGSAVDVRMKQENLKMIEGPENTEGVPKEIPKVNLRLPEVTTPTIKTAASTVDSKLRTSRTRTASRAAEIYKNTRAASKARVQQQASKNGQNKGKIGTGSPTSSHSKASGSLATSNKSEGDSSLPSSTKESPTTIKVAASTIESKFLLNSSIASRAASAARAQQQASTDGQNKSKSITGSPTSSHSSGSLVTSNNTKGDSFLPSSATKESFTSSSSSPKDNKDAVGSPKPSTSTGGPTGPLRSTDGDPAKKKRSPTVIQDHISLLEGDPLMYQCNICNKKFKTKAQIKYHDFCKEQDKPFKCETCGQGFITKSHYEYHLRTHTGERPYVCPKCGKGFNQRGKVTRHMRSHTGEKPFVCQECNRGFATAQALRTHTLIHTGERPFPCTYCDKRFICATNLKKHVITHTGERPFTCHECGKSFGLKWTLDLHLRTHSSERPNACNQCSSAFSNSKDLRRHLLIHSGEKPFQCWMCGAAFARKDNFERHAKMVHNQSKDVSKESGNK